MPLDNGIRPDILNKRIYDNKAIFRGRVRRFEPPPLTEIFVRFVKTE